MTETKEQNSNEVSDELYKQAEEFADKMERRGCGAWRGLRLGFIAGKQHQSNTSAVSDNEIDAEIERYVNQYCPNYEYSGAVRVGFYRAIKGWQEKRSKISVDRIKNAIAGLKVSLQKTSENNLWINMIAGEHTFCLEIFDDYEKGNPDMDECALSHYVGEKNEPSYAGSFQGAIKEIISRLQ